MRTTFYFVSLSVGFDFQLPLATLHSKGFKVTRWQDNPPSPVELARVLQDCCQLWIISTTSQCLNNEHARVIQDFFFRGGGVFLWGDNEPFYMDANFIGKYLFNGSMSGNSPGKKIVRAQINGTGAGFLPNHFIMTGIESLYEVHI